MGERSLKAIARVSASETIAFAVHRDRFRLRLNPGDRVWTSLWPIAPHPAVARVRRQAPTCGTGSPRFSRKVVPA
jgi:hypothetical protein